MQLSEHDLSILKHSPGGIYAISRVGDYRCYIGSSVDVRQRLREHARYLSNEKHHSSKLQNAVNKHGIEAFEVFLIEAVPNKEDLIKREQWWLDLNAAASPNHGYNALPRAGSVLGLRHNDKTRTLISAATRRQFSDPKQRAMASERARRQFSDHSMNPMKNPETAAKVWETRRANGTTGGLSGENSPMKRPEVRAKVSETKRNKSPEQVAESCAKGWETRRARGKSSPSEETRAKISASLLGNKISPESIAKSAATKARNKERKRRNEILANLADLSIYAAA